MNWYYRHHRTGGRLARPFIIKLSREREESMNGTRRFSRITLIEKSFVEFVGRSIEVSLVDVSLKGALVEFETDNAIRKGDILRLAFHLGNTDIILRFKAEVVHSHKNRVGVKFTETDLDTMIHLRSLIEARTMDPEKVRDELGFLIEGQH
jgi:hypothetical protein